MSAEKNDDDSNGFGHDDRRGGPVTRLRQEVPNVSLAYKDHLISGPDHASVREFIDTMVRSEERRARWPADGCEAMTALARLFPSMRDVPGTEPWNVDDLISWCKSGAPTSGSGWAARFLLSVWNPGTNWNEYGLPGAGRFDVMEAWACWDDPHRAAAMKWFDAPFWP